MVQLFRATGDFLFRIPSQLAEEDTKAFKTRSPSSTLVFTYVQKVDDELKFAKVDVNDKVREDPKFVHQKKVRPPTITSGNTCLAVEEEGSHHHHHRHLHAHPPNAGVGERALPKREGGDDFATQDGLRLQRETEEEGARGQEHRQEQRRRRRRV